jgi:hypothetical protein
MHRRSWLVALAGLFFACDPVIPFTPQTPVVTALFDPAQTPPVLPTPNDLAINPATGLLAIPLSPDASAADQELVAYLNTLDGYPSDSTAMAQFDATLNSGTVTSNNVLVYDVTAGLTRVQLNPSYTALTGVAAASQVSVGPPATGFIAGHQYAVAIIGGTSGIQSSSGAPVVGSPTWFFIRSANPLVVNCTDLTQTTCVTATNLIPSTVTDDPAARLADQTKTAIQLEKLRLKYKPAVDQVVSDGHPRDTIALLWEFGIASAPQVAFNPPGTVPTPNDLAIDPTTGLVNVPTSPSDSPAYLEFIHDYLDTLDGFPASSVASVGIQGGALNPSTVTLRSVLVASLNGVGLSGAPVPAYDATAHALTITPPNGTWGKGNELGVGIVGGSSGIHAANGGPVIAAPAWVLVRGTAKLVDCMITCTNPAAPVVPAGCVSTVTVVPLNLMQASGLECLRETYAPLVDGFEAQGVARADLTIAWTFRTSSLPEVTFDPTNQVIPFPNNLLRGTGANAHLMLPVPAGAGALEQGLVAELNTLDGFSLTAPAVSESSPTLGPIDVGLLDAATLNGGTGFIALAGATQTPHVLACLNCASSPLPNGTPQTSPQQLQFVPQVPLDERSTYAAYLTTALKDTSGHHVTASPTFALLRLSNPVCDASTMTSLVPSVSNTQACAPGGLEQTRQALKPLFDALAAAGVMRAQLTLAWAYTTQSTVSTMTALHDAVPAVGLPTAADSVFPVPVSAVAPPGLPVNALGTTLYMGTVELPVALTGPGGTMAPPAAWSSEKALFLLTVPAASPPAGGWPIVLYGHGLTATRYQMIAIANALATGGRAALAVDEIWHGDRTTCTGSGAVLQQALMNPAATDDWACAASTNPLTPDPVDAMCNAAGRCVARAGTGADCSAGGDGLCFSLHQGHCNAGACEGATFATAADGTPLINAWNFLNLTNLLATRDNFRHYPLDLAQMERVFADTSGAGLSAKLQAVGGPALDGTQIGYVGVSLSGFTGTLFAATDKNVPNIALNVPGSDQTQVLLISPAFATQRTQFLGALATAGITPGTPEFDNFVVLSKTIFDAGDPQNYGLAAVNGGPATRKVFMQWIQGDQVVPNPTTDELVAAATQGPAMPMLQEVNPPLASVPPANRHGFALNFVDPPTTIAAQTAITTFIVTGSPQ